MEENRKTDMEVVDTFSCMAMVSNISVTNKEINVTLLSGTFTLTRCHIEIILRVIGDRKLKINTTRRVIVIEREDHKCNCIKPEPTPDPEPEQLRSWGR